LGIKERHMYNNPTIAWPGTCVYLATQYLSAMFDEPPKTGTDARTGLPTHVLTQAEARAE
jgi:hypothetical protein